MTSSRQLPDDAWKRTMLAAFLVLWAISCIHVPYPEYFWLQHVPTVTAVLALFAADWRWQISCLSHSLILAFMLLHLLGARYLYSYVPYDEWAARWLGLHITSRFGFTRNHYDRIVHFCFGLLLVIPAWRFSRRIVNLNSAWSTVSSLSLILSASAAYEIFEWLAALVMAPDWAESYYGQQGDPWDAQWDMALAICGALSGLAAAFPWWLRRSGHDTVKS
jgi:putative membrane protein